MKTIPFALSCVASAMLLQGCISTAPKIGDDKAKTVATGAAGGAASANANSQLEKCSQPVGTLAVVEDQQAPWFQQLVSQYRLPSTTPVLRLLIQQSNCFIIVERGRAMANMQQERALQQSGELRNNSNFGQGQMVSADYSLSPEVLFSARGTQGIGGAVAMVNPILGALAAGMQTNEAATMLTLVDNRSGVQVGAAEGSSSNTDFGFGGLLAGGGAAAGLGGYTSTPQGKVVAAAFMNSYNQLVQVVRTYKPQTMGSQGLGTGGKLSVDGSSPAPAPAAAVKPVSTAAPAASTVRLSPKDAQTKLNALGYDVGTPDGVLGRKSVAAIRKFQGDKGLPVTGQLDSATQGELSK